MGFAPHKREMGERTYMKEVSILILFLSFVSCLVLRLFGLLWRVGV